MAKRATPHRVTPTAAEIAEDQRKAAAGDPRPTPPRPKGGPIKVQATRLGFYDHKRRREGDVFTIASPADFSEVWMRRVSHLTPERITTGQEDLRRKLEEIKVHGEDAGENPLGAE